MDEYNTTLKELIDVQKDIKLNISVSKKNKQIPNPFGIFLMEQLSDPTYIQKVQNEVLRIFGDQYRALKEENRDQYRKQYSEEKEFYRKKRTNAYFHYVKQNIGFVQLSENQNKTDRVKQLAASWQLLSDEEKNKYKQDSESNGDLAQINEGKSILDNIEDPLQGAHGLQVVIDKTQGPKVVHQKNPARNRKRAQEGEVQSKGKKTKNPKYEAN